MVSSFLEKTDTFLFIYFYLPGASVKATLQLFLRKKDLSVQSSNPKKIK